MAVKIHMQAGSFPFKIDNAYFCGLSIRAWAIIVSDGNLEIQVYLIQIASFFGFGNTNSISVHIKFQGVFNCCNCGLNPPNSSKFNYNLEKMEEISSLILGLSSPRILFWHNWEIKYQKIRSFEFSYKFISRSCYLSPIGSKTLSLHPLSNSYKIFFDLIFVTLLCMDAWVRLGW